MPRMTAGKRINQWLLEHVEPNLRSLVAHFSSESQTKHVAQARDEIAPFYEITQILRVYDSGSLSRMQERRRNQGQFHNGLGRVILFLSFLPNDFYKFVQ
jgi:hypothetical protein